MSDVVVPVLLLFNPQSKSGGCVFALVIDYSLLIVVWVHRLLQRTIFVLCMLNPIPIAHYFPSYHLFILA